MRSNDDSQNRYKTTYYTILLSISPNLIGKIPILCKQITYY